MVSRFICDGSGKKIPAKPKERSLCAINILPARRQQRGASRAGAREAKLRGRALLLRPPRADSRDGAQEIIDKVEAINLVPGRNRTS